MSSENYEFRISAFTPSSIPMARLAQYMAELASLLGNSENVHFASLKKGSVRVVARVANEAAPKVSLRVNSARDPTGPPEVGKRAAVNEAYAFTESATLEGTIARVGGIDETAHRSKLVHS
jgi:hypothetical protein